MKKNNKKGFTLAELLIVVAIIGVLVAISIPIFTAQLEKSREAVDVSNLRAAYGIAQADALTDAPEAAVTKWYDPNAGTLKDALVACGKGTKAETSSKWDLPTVITYDTKTDTTALGIKVVYDKNGVSSCAFAAS